MVVKVYTTRLTLGVFSQKVHKVSLAYTAPTDSIRNNSTASRMKATFADRTLCIWNCDVIHLSSSF